MANDTTRYDGFDYVTGTPSDHVPTATERRMARTLGIFDTVKSVHWRSDKSQIDVHWNEGVGQIGNLVALVESVVNDVEDDLPIQTNRTGSVVTVKNQNRTEA